MKLNRPVILPLLLVLLGLLQSIGYLAQNRILKGIGAASAASPLPVVFTSVKGLETFSSVFEMEITFGDGKTRHIDITPQLYACMEGPYNLRNVYGAAFAYGPLLPEPVWKSIFTHGFSQEGTLAKGLGITSPPAQVKIKITNHAGENKQTWILQLDHL